MSCEGERMLVFSRVGCNLLPSPSEYMWKVICCTTFDSATELAYVLSQSSPSSPSSTAHRINSPLGIASKNRKW